MNFLPWIAGGAAVGLAARTSVKPKRLTPEVVATLQPNTLVLVYHGTRLMEAPKFLYGFDANTVHYRHYGGPRHAGLFVTSKIKWAEEWADYGELVLEIAVKARYLHGTDYSGNIGRVQGAQREWDWKYPKSFRPYLSSTLARQGREAQALLRGLVSPQQLLRVRYKPYGKEPRWYTRDEFVRAGIVVPDRFYPKSITPRGGYDFSFPGYTYPQLVQAVAQSVGVSPQRVETTLTRTVRYAREGKSDILGGKLLDFLTQVGFGSTAARSYNAKLIRGTLKGQPT